MPDRQPPLQEDSRSWTLYVCETCQATCLRDEADLPHGGPLCWCQNTAPRVMTAVEVVPRADAEALAGALDEFDRYASVDDGTAYAGSPFGAKVRALLAIYPKAEEESHGQ